jgi:hypothetical protein
MWNWNAQFGLAVALLVAGFLLYSLVIDRAVIGIGTALMAGGAVACVVLLVKRFVLDRIDA